MQRPRIIKCLLRFGIFGVVLAGAFSGSCRCAYAQLPQTTLSSVLPAGGKIGSTLEVKVAGANLEEVTRLVFNHPAIKSVQKVLGSAGKKTPVANTFLVTIGPQVPAGLYEVRAVGLYGMSNPRTFVVGRLRESKEKEPNNSIDTANLIQINESANGSMIGAADTDFFKFVGKKGQRIVASCRAARIDSRMRAALELYAPDGRRLGFSRNAVREDPLLVQTLPSDGTYAVKIYDFTYRNGADYFYRLSVHSAPLIDFVLPAAGLPGTTAKFTLYGRNLPGGQSVGLRLDGEPLQKLIVSIAVPKGVETLRSAENLRPHESAIDGFSYVFKSQAGDSNPVFIQYASTPALLEKEPNDTPQQSQKISLPADVTGQFQSPGDVDYFTFTAKAKEVYYIEVFGHRSGTQADPYLILEQVTKNAKGVEKVRRITAQDDTAAPGKARKPPNPFRVASDDPVYRFQVPADGNYRVNVRDRYFESRGDPRLVYHLVVRKSAPDFRIIVLPETPPKANNQPTTTGSIALRQGENLGVRVTLFRRDGFKGTVDLRVEGLPPGVVCKGATIGSGETETQLIFTSAEKAAAWSGMIRVFGKSQIDSPEKIATVTRAKAHVTAANAALPKLRKIGQTTAAAAKIVNARLQKAKAVAAKKPKDKNLAKAAAAAQAAANKANATAQTAQSGLAVAVKGLADAQSTVKKAEAARIAARRTVQRLARPATIVWNGSTVTPSISHVSKSLGLSVIKESAPFQVITSVFRVEANQGRQILVPILLKKRNGFNKQVTMTFNGLPKNSNIQIQNKNIPKGKNSELLRLFVKSNAKIGTYTLYLKSQGQVAYRRNLGRLKIAKTKQAVVAKAATAAAAVSKKISAAQTAAVKKATADTARVKATTIAKTAAAKKAVTAATGLKQATAAKVKADQANADAQTALKTATAKVAAAMKTSQQKPKDKKRTALLVAAQKVLTAKTAAGKRAAIAKSVADKKFAAAGIANQAAVKVLNAANKAQADAQAAAKISQTARVQAVAAAKGAAAKAKSATAAKTIADRELAAANKAAKPVNINIFPPSTPIIIVVKKGAATLSLSVPKGGSVKRGGKLGVKVTLKRINGFNGPVTLSLPLPPGVKGVSMAAVTIPAGKTAGVLSIRVASGATLGQLANMVVRGTMTFAGKSAVDAPLTIKVSK